MFLRFKIDHFQSNKIIENFKVNQVDKIKPNIIMIIKIKNLNKKKNYHSVNSLLRNFMMTMNFIITNKEIQMYGNLHHQKNKIINLKRPLKNKYPIEVM
jgi:hypothetical protein